MTFSPPQTLWIAAELAAGGVHLRPCPFCGERHDLQLIDDGIYWPTVTCMNCGARMEHDTAVEAADAWNRRMEAEDAG